MATKSLVEGTASTRAGAPPQSCVSKVCHAAACVLVSINTMLRTATTQHDATQTVAPANCSLNKHSAAAAMALHGVRRWYTMDYNEMWLIARINATDTRVAIRTHKTYFLSQQRLVYGVPFSTALQAGSRITWLAYTGSAIRRIQHDVHLKRLVAVYAPRVFHGSANARSFGRWWPAIEASWEQWRLCLRSSWQLYTTPEGEEVRKRLRADGLLDAPLAPTPLDQGYVFAGGNADRNFSLVVEAARLARVRLVVATTTRQPAAEAACRLLQESTGCIYRSTSPSEFLSLMANASVVAMPMKMVADGDGHGMTSFMEARRMGKAVIVTPHTQWTANGDVMTHGRDGFVADCASVQCFTRGLLELRARPRILGELAINSFALAVGAYAPRCERRWMVEW